MGIYRNLTVLTIHTREEKMDFKNARSLLVAYPEPITNYTGMETEMVLKGQVNSS